MTCIATDGKIMAADSRSCVGDMITTDDAEKLVRMPDGSVAGCAGDRTACQLVREWLGKGAPMDTVPVIKGGKDETPFDALVLRPDGRVEFLDYHFTFVERSLPASIGTGSEVAIGLMLAEVGPVEAVEAVATRVITVGGPVRSLKPGKPHGRA